MQSIFEDGVKTKHPIKISIHVRTSAQNLIVRTTPEREARIRIPLKLFKNVSLILISLCHSIPSE